MSQAPEACPECKKVPELCLCASVAANPLGRMKTRLHVLVLQHPQEPDKTLGSAMLTHKALANSTLRVGLSWPNLKKALGREVEPSKWGVLYLGGKPQGDQRPKGPPPLLQIKARNSKQLAAYEPGESPPLEGIVVLDGTWSQAKTLWWRNAWLLKLHRLVLTPRRRSLYGELRREPRRECLSTIESVAEALDALGERPEVGEQLRSYFAELLKRYRATL